ncbi:tape measure domain protein, partial [Enterococcus faecalis 06-MB-DW-09]
MAIEKIAVEITSNAKNIEKELDSIDKRLAQLNNKKYDLTINAEKLQNARNEISKIDTQMKELQARKAILKTDSAEIIEAKKKLDEINAKMKSLQAEKATIKADATSVDDAKEKVAAIDKQLASLSKNKATIQADVSKVTEAKKEVIDIDAQLKQLSARKATLQVTTTNLKGADTELKNLHKEMESLNNKKARLQISQEDVESSKSRLSGLVQQLTSLNSKTTKVTLSDNIDDVANKLDNLGNKLLQPFGGGKFGDMLGLGLAFKGVDKAVSMISGSFGGAVSRLDTLNNFPKTMSNMNISVEQSSAAIEALSDGLTGLPTTVDAAASSVQQFTNKNKDIEKSTGMFLSLNNALIAGGQGAQIQESALNQLSRAYSIGTMDLNTWRSMQQAMPAQLSQVAKAFGKSEQALFEALQKGDKSMDEFMDKIMELNETGIDGFQSFEEQARNSAGGLQTAMSTMQSAVTRGTTSIIDSFDKILGGGESGGFAEVFGFIGKQFEDGLKAVAALVEKHGDKIAAAFQKVKTTIEEFDFATFFRSFAEGLGLVGDGFSFLSSVGKPVLDLFGRLIAMVGGGSFEAGLGKIIGHVVSAGIFFKVAAKSLKLFSAVGKPVIGVIGGIGGAIGKLFGRGGKAPKMPQAFDFGNMFGNLLKNAGNLALVFGAIKVVEAAAQAMQSINDKVPDDFSSFGKKIGNMAIALTAMGGLMAAAGWIVDKNPEVAIKGLIAVTAISLELMLVAEAISQMDAKIPDDMGSFGKKVANMAIAIAAMGGLMTAAGYITKSNPVAAVAGLVAVTAIALELMLVAEAISQVDAKIPDDVASFSKKIANMAIAIGAMGALIGVAGGLMMTGVG